jgi:hypothetical protein
MDRVWSVLRFALRAAVWRTTPDPRVVGLRSLVAWSAVLAMVRAGLQLIDAVPSPDFNPYGLNAVVAWIALALAVATFFVPRVGRVTVLSAMVVLAIVAEIVIAALDRGALLILSRFALGDDSTSTNITMAILLVHSVWWIGAMLALFRSVHVEARARRLGKVVALWLALLAVNVVVPHSPVFVGPNFDISRANWWEFVHAQYLARKTADGAADPDIGTAAIERLQPALLQAAFARLAPPTKGATNIYAIGLAGWSDQDVFLKELDGALAAIGRDLPIADRALRLVNQPGTVESVPLASRRNFAAAVHAVGKIMNRQDDVLILLMTSHGTGGGVALRFPDGGSALLGPQEVASVLDHEGIKNRVVIVSACFAGVFVKPLANDDTIVLTAADENNASFGCAPERDWTYFGDALFNQSLQPGTDFKRAFNHAKLLIGGWERLDRAPSSNPQGYFGTALVEKLAPVFQSMSQAGQ